MVKRSSTVRIFPLERMRCGADPGVPKPWAKTDARRIENVLTAANSTPTTAIVKVRRVIRSSGPILFVSSADSDRRHCRSGPTLDLQRLDDEREFVRTFRSELVELEILQQMDAVDDQHY